MRTFLLTTAIGLIAFLVSLDGFIINQEVTTTFSTLDVKGYQPLALTNEVLLNQASTLGLADIYYLYAWIFVGLIIPVLLVKRQEA